MSLLRNYPCLSQISFRVTYPLSLLYVIFPFYFPASSTRSWTIQQNYHIQLLNYISVSTFDNTVAVALYAREDVVTTIVTTLPDATGYTVIPAATIETVITRTLATITVTSTETAGAIESYSTTTSFASAEFSISCTNEVGSSCNELTETTTTFPVEEESYLSYEGSTSTLTLTETISTEVQVAESAIEIITDGITTQVTLDGITTTVITTISTSVDLVASASTITIEPTPYTLTVPTESRSADSAYSETTTLSATVFTLSVDSVTTKISLESTSVELTQITTVTLTIPESTSYFVT